MRVHLRGRLLFVLVRKEPECLRQACRRLLREEYLIHIALTRCDKRIRKLLLICPLAYLILLLGILCLLNPVSVNDPHRTLGSHHSDLCDRPRINHIRTHHLAVHRDKCASVSLPHNQGHLRHRCFRKCCGPGKKAGTSTSVRIGIRKQSQNRMKRAILSAAS